jgi:hypothetical protein
MIELEDDIKKLINDLPVKEITNIIHMKYDVSKKTVYDIYLKLKNNS